ncbi:4-(cytidine 5'-diphospho)-2-C-methyl-D-erythritol kinase [Aureimonas phyllosphaerae]|uniref:4-diphosphocytidyl-2-C-methyl-D-erythritol kinase n=1 Tax=Aureimonas phyllosphaerae TaxID=1166078 RepID=A0A7W6BLR5_9HYPH|nr:4-(cytidine 5'-diphospho)-2-C-methyl-D-erythritol kinase [Aureimonas phyllosphaerae]MBB3934328.1 4-diphosphocytidyl-2-C-methyl-D-erythritol kinase [Aureimonas phyllosphaerae]MBB3958456.1 4-diphosphocytidyl-2-C-methyl-D-erythritol kinase [Aureimonas phyllosphaerae]SFE97345.1 4-diphosphocytidyl-2-C-methyl-D-erythritol kinase [Aureimonas phyllosphaerae]
MDAFVHVPWVTNVTARAKINLALHVVGRRVDGYHELESLVAFAEFGDRLQIAPGTRDALSVDGPLGAGVPTDGGNLVMKALALAQELAPASGVRLSPLAIRLSKHLPHAAGIGGGSADAGALLAWIGARHPALRPSLAERCVSLGADVPMCLSGEAAVVRGIGERAERLAALPAIPVLLVNPSVPVATPAVFAGLARRDNAPLIAPPATGFSDLETLARYLEAARNDLEPPALGLAPAIGDAVDAVNAAGARFTRMSGSGATVFGLFASDAACHEAERRIAASRPGWWVKATQLTGQGS